MHSRGNTESTQIVKTYTRLHNILFTNASGRVELYTPAFPTLNPKAPVRTQRILLGAHVLLNLLNELGKMDKSRILGKCLLISSLPGKALRGHVDKMRSRSQAW